MKNHFRVIVSLFVLLFLLSSCAWLFNGDVDPEVYVEQGMEHFKNSEDSLAIVAWEKALILLPDDAELHFLIGVAYHKLNKIEKATSYFENALELDDTYYEAANSYGYMLFLLKRYDEAKKSFEYAIKLRSDYEPALKNLDLVLQVKMGSLDLQAFEAVEDASQKEYEEQIPIYQRAIEINPAYAKAHNNLAVALYFEGFYDSAYFHLEQALKIDREYPEALNNLGYLNKVNLNYELATRLFFKAIIIKPKYISALNNLGETYYLMKDYAGSVKVFDAALNLDPSNQFARNYIEKIKAEIGK